MKIDIYLVLFVLVISGLCFGIYKLVMNYLTRESFEPTNLPGPLAGLRYKKIIDNSSFKPIVFTPQQQAAQAQAIQDNQARFDQLIKTGIYRPVTSSSTDAFFNSLNALDTNSVPIPYDPANPGSIKAPIITPVKAPQTESFLQYASSVIYSDKVVNNPLDPNYTLKSYTD
jgi:hypothetical protein